MRFTLLEAKTCKTGARDFFFKGFLSYIVIVGSLCQYLATDNGVCAQTYTWQHMRGGGEGGPWYWLECTGFFVCVESILLTHSQLRLPPEGQVGLPPGRT